MVSNETFLNITPLEVLFIAGLTKEEYEDLEFSNEQTTTLMSIYRHLIRCYNFEILYKNRKRPSFVSVTKALSSFFKKSNGVGYQNVIFKVYNSSSIDSIITSEIENDIDHEVLYGNPRYTSPTVDYYITILNISHAGTIPFSKKPLLTLHPIYQQTPISYSQTHFLQSIGLSNSYIAEVNLDNSEETVVISDIQDDIDTAITNDTSEETFLSAHDLGVMYIDTFALLENTVVKIVNILGHEKSTKPIEYVDLFKSGGRYVLNLDYYRTDLKDLDFTLPILGAINVDNYVVFTTRLHKKSSPSRYRKGLCMDTVSFYNLSKKECFKTGIKDIIDMDRDSHQTQFLNMISHIFKPKHFTYQEALDSVLNFERLSTAFNSCYSIKLDSELDSIHLMRGIYPIAEYDLEEKGFRTFIDIFNEDLLSFGIPLIN